jgi:hypothetical protein
MKKVTLIVLLFFLFLNMYKLKGYLYRLIRKKFLVEATFFCSLLYSILNLLNDGEQKEINILEYSKKLKK